MHDAAPSQSNCGVLVSSSQGLSVKNPSLLSARRADRPYSSSSSSSSLSSTRSPSSVLLRSDVSSSPSSFNFPSKYKFTYSAVYKSARKYGLLENPFSTMSFASLPSFRPVECLRSLHHNRSSPALARRCANESASRITFFPRPEESRALPPGRGLAHVENPA